MWARRETQAGPWSMEWWSLWAFLKETKDLRFVMRETHVQELQGSREEAWVADPLSPSQVAPSWHGAEPWWGGGWWKVVVILCPTYSWLAGWLLECHTVPRAPQPSPLPAYTPPPPSLPSPQCPCPIPLSHYTPAPHRNVILQLLLSCLFSYCVFLYPLLHTEYKVNDRISVTLKDNENLQISGSTVK